MKLLINPNKFSKLKTREAVPLSCKNCNEIFFRPKNEIQKTLKKCWSSTLDFCSKRCYHLYHASKEISCENCNQIFLKKQNQIKKTKHHFCTKSCSAKYFNQRKAGGCRRSKLELWIEKQLLLLYPQLNLQFNNKQKIKSELDIYIPKLKLAFEINGIFHYEPIYGLEKLNSIQSNDKQKFRACFEKGIELCIINASNQKKFAEKTANKYLKIIQNIIENRLSN